MASEFPVDAIRMWRVYKTTCQMLSDRGYSIGEDKTDISKEEFSSKFCDENGLPVRKMMNFQANPTAAMEAKFTPLPTKRDPTPESTIGTVWVEFFDAPGGDKTLGTAPFKNFISFVVDNKFHTGIFIYGSALTNNAGKLIPTAQPSIVEFFQEADLLVNITKHELVPKHVILSPLEKKQLLERYRLKETQLPRIQQIDPVARYLGLRRQQVVKIIRRSETAGRCGVYKGYYDKITRYGRTVRWIESWKQAWDPVGQSGVLSRAIKLKAARDVSKASLNYPWLSAGLLGGLRSGGGRRKIGAE